MALVNPAKVDGIWLNFTQEIFVSGVTVSCDLLFNSNLHSSGKVRRTASSVQADRDIFTLQANYSTS